MIITVGGLVGSGKSTLAKALADSYRFTLVSIGQLMRDLARKKGVSLLQLSKIAEANDSIDRELDKRQKEVAKGDCVVDSRLGAHILKSDFKIWLTAPLETRVQRTSNRDGVTNDEAIKSIRSREKSERTRYLKYYNIVLDDLSQYDLVINTGLFTVEQTVSICRQAIDAIRS
ncbi:MAG: AAA family ATPase [Candidatus Altiarchaeota archaeon]|nr:AAA family ATPase [Candidatus Altiarchaeota archaeon]